MDREKKVIFYERLKELIDSSGQSFNEVERVLGYTRNALHNYKRGGLPSGVRLLEISNYLGVSPEYLMGKEDKQEVLNVKITFKNLTLKQKFEMLLIAQEWGDNQIRNGIF